MSRPLRHHPPGAYHFITTRCLQALFLLRPDPELNRLVLVWLARAQRFRPGVRLHGFKAMSNHTHTVIHDTDGSLAEWARYFFGNLAKSINALRRRSGAVWARRYSDEHILDDAALLDRIVYLATNSVAARLCETYTVWPGITLIAGGSEPEHIPVSWFDPERYDELCRQAEVEGRPRPDRVEGIVNGEVTVYPPPQHLVDTEQPSPLIAAIATREEELRDERIREGRGVMTPEAIRSQPWNQAPASPKRSNRPLCHTTEPSLRKRFLEAYRAFVDAFRTAAADWAKGIFNAAFPDWCYRPGGGLVRHPPPLATG